MNAVDFFALVLLVIAAIGLVLSLVDARDTWNERKGLELLRQQSELLWIIAHGNLRTSVFTLGVFFCFVVVMGLAMGMELSNFRTMVTRTGVFGAMLLLTLKRVYDRLDRMKIRRIQHDAAIHVLPGSDLELIGGPTAIDQFTAGLYARILRDDLLQHHFIGINVSMLIRTQAEWITRRLVGKPSAVDLRKAHAHLRISSLEFDRFMNIAQETLADFDIPPDLGEKLLGIMLSTREQIVDRRREQR